jgi:uncharacterized protein
MRVVLDTNVIASGLLGGALKTIVDEWKAGKFTLVVSEAITREYLEVFNRPKLKISADEIATTTEYLLKTAEFVTPRETIAVIDADPTDNKFLEAAVDGKAIYVVSGDSHLLDLKKFREIQIITAREFITILQNQS